MDFPASGSWNVPAPPSENPQLLLRRFVFDLSLCVGLSASRSSREPSRAVFELLDFTVELEAELEVVSSACVTTKAMAELVWHTCIGRAEIRGKMSVLHRWTKMAGDKPRGGGGSLIFIMVKGHRLTAPPQGLIACPPWLVTPPLSDALQSLIRQTCSSYPISCTFYGRTVASTPNSGVSANILENHIDVFETIQPKHMRNNTKSRSHMNKSWQINVLSLRSCSRKTKAKSISGSRRPRR